MNVIPHAQRVLIDKYLSGSIKPEEFRELESTLIRDPLARQYFVRYCQLETQLHVEMRAGRASDKAMRLIRSLEDGASSGRDAQCPTAPEPSGSRSYLLSVAIGMTAATILLALTMSWWWIAAKTGRPAEVAWLVNAQNCRWATDSATAGDFRPGRTVALDDGLAELRFQNGATVILEGPARLELVSDATARLWQGRLSAHVPERARGFQILAPNGKIVDLGTDFGVSVDDSGLAGVFVFSGSVEAYSQAETSLLTTLTSGQAARIDASGVHLENQPLSRDAAGAVRAIELPARLVPRTLNLDFLQPVVGTLRDRSGRGTGLTHRLPGTGHLLSSDDEHLLLNHRGGCLELTTTNSDINTQFQLGQGEYPGVKLAALGFTGNEDFEITATFANIPTMEPLGQFGIYVGTGSDRNIRGGLIAGGPGDCTQFLVNNHGGRDGDLNYVGVTPYNTDVTLTLRRSSGRFSLTADNRTDGTSISLTTNHPVFLDDAADLFVGLFGANVQSSTPRTLRIKHLQVTVWTAETLASEARHAKTELAGTSQP